VRQRRANGSQLHAIERQHEEEKGTDKADDDLDNADFHLSEGLELITRPAQFPYQPSSTEQGTEKRCERKQVEANVHRQREIHHLLDKEHIVAR
jgi:hypothetical protein